MIERIRRAVFFAAHTDDEMVCAGTLHRLARSGAEVRVASFGWAGTEGNPGGCAQTNDVLGAEWRASMGVIGADPDESSPNLVDCCSKRLHEHGQEVADAAFALCESFRPDLVISLSPDDENPAHAVVGVQVRRVTRGRVPVHVEVNFPWNMSLGWPNVYVALAPEDVEAKRACIRCYESQLHRYRYEEMLMAQAAADGEAVKVRAAERFELIRGVV